MGLFLFVNDHFELFTFPYSDRALVLERNRTEEAPKPKNRTVAFLNDVLLENWALEAMAVTRGQSLAATVAGVDAARGERPLASACRLAALAFVRTGQ